MPSSRSMTATRILYKASCPPCRTLSRLAVFFSLGLVRRTPVDSAEARALYQQHPDKEGQIALIHRGSVAFGPAVFPKLPLIVLFEGLRMVRMCTTSRTDAG